MFTNDEIKRSAAGVIANLQSKEFETAKGILDDTIYNLGFDIEGFSGESPEIAEEMQETMNILEMAAEGIDGILYDEPDCEEGDEEAYYTEITDSIVADLKKLLA